jgi:hypothetical protein
MHHSYGHENHSRKIVHAIWKAASTDTIAHMMKSRKQLMVVERGSRKAGSAHLERAEKVVGRRHKACARGHADGAGGQAAENHCRAGSDDDGVARRERGESEEGKKEAAIVCLQRLSGAGGPYLWSFGVSLLE